MTPAGESHGHRTHALGITLGATLRAKILLLVIACILL